MVNKNWLIMRMDSDKAEKRMDKVTFKLLIDAYMVHF